MQRDYLEFKKHTREALRMQLYARTVVKVSYVSSYNCPCVCKRAAAPENCEPQAIEGRKKALRVPHFDFGEDNRLELYFFSQV